MAEEIQDTQGEELEEQTTDEELEQEQTSEEEEVLNEEDINVTSMIEALLGNDSNPENQTEDNSATDDEEELEEEKPAETEETLPEETVYEPLPIDDKLVEAFPVLRGLSGKDLKKDLPQSYANLVKKMNEQAQEIAQHKSKIQELETKSTQVQKVDEDEIPDYIDDPEGHDKALIAIAEKNILAKIEERFETQKKVPQVDSPQEANPVLGYIQGKLPKEVNAQDVINEFVKNNPELFFDEYGDNREDTLQYFNRNPKAFIAQVMNFYDLKVTKQSKAELEKQKAEFEKNKNKEVKTKTYEQTKKTLLAAKNRPVPKSEVNLSSRKEPELSKEEIIYGEILKNQPQVLTG